MPKAITPGRINTAEIVMTLDPEVKVNTETDGTLLARRLFITLDHTDGHWNTASLEVSAAKPAPRVGGYSTLYRKTSDFKLEGRIREIVEDVIQRVKTDAKNRS